MTRNKHALFSAVAIMLIALIPATAWAQHKHGGQKQAGMPGMKMHMAKMMKSPHHKLMMAYMKGMSTFATTLRDQAMKSESLEVEVARATVAELRHNLDAMDALKQKHMQSMGAEMQAMSADMQSKMKMMMEKMDKAGATLKGQVAALETDVQADKQDSAQVTAHANALLKHLGMMTKMAGGGKAKKKMAMKKEMKMDPKTDPKMDMKKKM